MFLTYENTWYSHVIPLRSGDPDTLFKCVHCFTLKLMAVWGPPRLDSPTAHATCPVLPHGTLSCSHGTRSAHFGTFGIFGISVSTQTPHPRAHCKGISRGQRCLDTGGGLWLAGRGGMKPQPKKGGGVPVSTFGGKHCFGFSGGNCLHFFRLSMDTYFGQAQACPACLGSATGPLTSSCCCTTKRHQSRVSDDITPAPLNNRRPTAPGPSPTAGDQSPTSVGGYKTAVGGNRQLFAGDHRRSAVTPAFVTGRAANHPPAICPKFGGGGGGG